MADGVAITAGSGTTISTDDCTTAGHVQRVKIAYGADGDATQVAADANGLKVQVGPALPAGDNNIGNVDIVTVPADPFGANADAANSAGSISAKLRFIAATGIPVTAISAGDNNIGNVDIVTVPADPFGANADVASTTGSISAKLRSIAATGIPVTAVTPGTSSANLGKQEDAAHNSGDTGVMLLGVRNVAHATLSDANGDYTPINVDSEGCVSVVGNMPHDGIDADPPIKIGAKAVAGLSGLTLVAAADRSNLFCGLDGALIVRPHCGLEDIVYGNASNTDGTSFQVIAAQAAGIKTYLTNITITNTSTTACYVEIKDGTTVKMTIPVPAQGGANVALAVPLPGTAATAWNCDPSGAITTIICSMVGFISKE